MNINYSISTPIDIDSYPAGQQFQCWDYSIFVARQIMGSQYFTPLCLQTGGVKDWVLHEPSKQQWLDAGWVWVANDFNDPNQVPKEGDVFVKTNSSWGHTGIIKNAVAGSPMLTIVDENAETGSGSGRGGDAPIERQVPYTYFDGWFTYIKSSNYPEIPDSSNSQNNMPTNFNDMKKEYLQKELASFNSNFDVDWIRARINQTSEREIAQVINEVYGWKINAEIEKAKASPSTLGLAPASDGEVKLLKEITKLKNTNQELQNQITELQSEKNKPHNLPVTAPTPTISQSIPVVVQDVPVITQVANNNKSLNYTELAKYIPAILLILNPFLQKQFGVQLVSEDLSTFLQFLGGLITTQLQAIKK